MDTALQSLRDVKGVLGSFLLDEHGQLLARDMPSMFDSHALGQASLRLSQLRAALELGKEGFEGCTARFGGHLLVVRAAEARTLCVLCPVGTDLSTLTMGINLASRRVSAPRWPSPQALASSPSLHAPLMPDPLGVRSAFQLATAGSEAGRESTAHDPSTTTRFFRGRPVL